MPKRSSSPGASSWMRTACFEYWIRNFDCQLSLQFPYILAWSSPRTGGSTTTPTSPTVRTAGSRRSSSWRLGSPTTATTRISCSTCTSYRGPGRRRAPTTGVNQRLRNTAKEDEEKCNVGRAGSPSAQRFTPTPQSARLHRIGAVRGSMPPDSDCAANRQMACRLGHERRATAPPGTRLGRWQGQR